ncbi:c-type heme family protein [Desulfitobacterium hafniense]|nr:DUF3365 domain-containing protein [Desulfitobacterium hafniense]KTE91547.1 hypothetical protein AT727_21880 [Desulfitobacterium hafniense]
MERSMVVDNRHLSTKFTVLVTSVIIVAVVIYLAWSINMQQAATEDKVLAEARTLSIQMSAAWDYINDSQTAINYNSDGSYDFKGVYCSIAGKDIAQRFTRQSEGYIIRYARENPRSGTDEPDVFERKALTLFATGESREQYGIEKYKGEMVFRYTSAIEIRHNCLPCHGEPAGEKDETGFIKEGMKVGDIAGASSIIIPLDLYAKEARTRTLQTIGFFLVLLFVVIAVVRFALRKWVTEPLTQANLELHDENEMKSNFLTIMSHELKTPLSSIIAFTDIWEKSSREKSEDEQRLVQEIKENSRTLLNMVNNTIDVARLEAGRFEITYDEVELVDIVSAVVSVAHPIAVKHNISLEKRISPDTPIIISDWEALRKILMNLVSNALKFTGAGGKVDISVSYLSDRSRVVIQVADTGAGIPEKDHDQIFERFTQSTQPGDERINGSGLGLFLVKTLTEKLGGEIEVDSVVERGSSFSVYVPIDSSK